jgi:diaminopimelate decarboxylase
MNPVDSILARYFASSKGELLIGGVPVGKLADRYGTPLFIYDAGVLERKWEMLRRVYPAPFTVSYSVKANPNPSIVKYFVDQGGGLEIASGGEFKIALQVGCPAERILFAGPGKSEAELEFVLAHRIGEIHAESLLEIERLGAISRRLGVKANVAVRVNPSAEAQGGAMLMGGRPAPFGVDEENLDAVVDRIMAERSLVFSGVHLFTGTQILDYTVLARQHRKALEIAQRVAGRIQRPLATVDFGGGLGVPYFADETELDMEKLRDAMADLMGEIQGDPLFEGTRFVLEPGRYLVAEAGIYVARVNDLKISRGKKFLIVDGGMNHHLAASGNLGQVIKRNFPLVLLNRLGEEPTETVDVVGPLCTPLDTLGREVRLPAARVGDLLGILQSGAYARTASPLGFLSHPSPAEVLVHNGHSSLIRRRGTDADLFGDVAPVAGADARPPL